MEAIGNRNTQQCDPQGPNPLCKAGGTAARPQSEEGTELTVGRGRGTAHMETLGLRVSFEVARKHCLWRSGFE